MNVLKSLTLITSLLLLSGCSTFGLFGGPDVQPVEVLTQEVQRTPLRLPNPEPVRTDTPNWVVITPENAEEVFTKMEEDGYDKVLFGLTDEGYEDLAIMMARIRNYIEAQRRTLDKYKEYYEPAEVTPNE